MLKLQLQLPTTKRVRADNVGHLSLFTPDKHEAQPTMASDHEDEDDDLYGTSETKPAQQSHTKEEQDASSGDEPMDEGADSGDDDDDEDDDSESVSHTKDK